MDGNLVVLIVMIALALGGGILLNFQIRHSEKKEREAQAKSAKGGSEARQAAAR